MIREKGEELAIPHDLLPSAEGDEELSFPTDLSFREAKERVVAAFEKRYLEEVLRRTGGKLTDAAKAAGMDNKNFSEKMKRHGVNLEAFRQE